MTNAIAYLDESAAGWERSLYAFLAEKERRSGSLRTVQSYSGMLQHFFGRAGMTPDQVTSQDVFAWAYGTGLSGRQPGSVTIGARIACLSSFYRFLIRMKVAVSNPCDALERPKVMQSLAPRSEWRADPPVARHRADNAGRAARPRDHPHVDLHRPAPR
jgi:site-specific recombinase XerD